MARNTYIRDARKGIAAAIKNIFQRGFNPGESLRQRISEETYYVDCISCSEDKSRCHLPYRIPSQTDTVEERKWD